MSKIKNYLLCLIGGTSVMLAAYAQNKNLNDYALMTARDVTNNSLSNVSIKNGTSTAVTAAGLYIVSFDTNDCSSCFGNIVGGDNLGGAVVSTITFNANQSIPIGQNYLYNMLYNGISYIVQTAGSSPCKLPGCSWAGDDPNVTGWCISINIGSRNSSYTHSNYQNGTNPPANMPPYSQAGNSNAFDYKYDLIDPNTLGVGNACIGPITCDDKTLTCSVATPQSETFQPYG